MRILHAVPLLLAFLAPLAPAAEPKPIAVDEKAIDAVLAKALKDFDAPGLACAIVKDDKVVYLKGHGVRDVTSPKPVTPDSLFGIASCSKAFTATAVGFLVADGKMAWDDPVRKHLPAYRMSDALADRDVTIRDLLCHRTGVIRHDILWFVNPWGREEMLRRAGFLRQDKSFRSAYGYNNLQYLAAGEAAGRAAGTSWEELVRSRIFEPLGMKSANFSTRDLEKAADFARPHFKEDGGKPAPIAPRNIDNMAPAGAINASVRDLSAWLRFQLGEGVFEGKRLLKGEIVRETRTPQVVVEVTPEMQKLQEGVVTQVSYGLGWRVYDYRGKRVIEHGGSIDGYRSVTTLLPDQKVGFVVLTNLALTPLPAAASFSLLDVLLGAPTQDWNAGFLEVDRKQKADRKKKDDERDAKRKPNTKPSLDLSGYAGRYDEDAHGQVNIRVAEGGLKMAWGMHEIKLEHFHFDTFRMKDPPGIYKETWGDKLVTFRLNSTGEVESFRYLGYDFRKARQGKK